MSYHSRKLARSGRQDLLDKVQSGQMTVLEACKEDGLVKDRPQINLMPGTSPAKLAGWLKAHFSPESLAELVAMLTGE